MYTITPVLLVDIGIFLFENTILLFQLEITVKIIHTFNIKKFISLTAGTH